MRGEGDGESGAGSGVSPRRGVVSAPAGVADHGGSDVAGRVVPRVVAVVVTWNRLATVRRVLSDLFEQSAAESGGRGGGARLSIVVVDNASEDGTAEAIHEEHLSSRRVDNRSGSGGRPVFTKAIGHLFAKPEPGKPEITIIRNRLNVGGCGGFNTGLAWVRQMADPPDFVWMVDDDARLPEDALERLLGPMRDGSVGLVGSRTVDLGDRASTIETTIYFDRRTGFMRDRPPADHPMHAAHGAWERGASGEDRFTGVVEVDVASACSLLSRWEAAEQVGPWDDSFFLYCDDADWCLRFQRAGWRVVCALDARVFHAPWHTKLTPVRDYYAKRNAVWMHRHALEGKELRRLSWRWPVWLCKESYRQWRAGRKLSAWMTVRALLDATLGRGGPLPDSGKGSQPAAVAYYAFAGVALGLALLVAPWVGRRSMPGWGVSRGAKADSVRAGTGENDS